jgi:hypothetical protein
MSNIIDELTETIRAFGISNDKKEFELSLDAIMSRLDIGSSENDEQWDMLRENYSKLKYLYEVINFYHLPVVGTKFIEKLPIGVF